MGGALGGLSGGLGSIGGMGMGAVGNIVDPALAGVGNMAKSFLGNIDQSNIIDAATKQQADEQYRNAQTGLDQQMQFLQQLQGQNGIQNQSNVYGQLSGIANGQGPNPAMAMLNQQTGNNIANQAALMAGQRGAGANTGLMARQAAQQGANLQQQAVGQGANMQANQSLNAIGQMGNMAGQQVQQQANATTGFNQMAQSEQQNILNAIGNQNSVHGSLDKAQFQAQADLMGHMMGAAGTAMGMANGGQVKGYADGGNVSMAGGPRSFIGNFLNSSVNSVSSDTSDLSHTQSPFAQSKKNGSSSSQDDSSMQSNMSDNTSTAPQSLDAPSPQMLAAKGGKVPVRLSPGEIYVPPSKVGKVAAEKESAERAGVRVPGKAKVKGDSLDNDTVDATLESGGMVIPRSIVNSKDAPKKAAAFVRAYLSRNK